MPTVIPCPGEVKKKLEEWDPETDPISLLVREKVNANCDNVNHPQHYCQGGIECIDAIKASMNTIEFQGYLKGNCMKYLWRWRNKGGVEDLRKASVYLNWLIKTIDGAEK